MTRILAFLAFILLVTGYAVPSIVAILRAQKRWPLVVAINIALGWTIAGWLVAFAMAVGFQMPKRKKLQERRRKRPPVFAPPVTSSAPARDAAPVRKALDPPQLQDESYTRWLEGGAAMGSGLKAGKRLEGI